MAETRSISRHEVLRLPNGNALFDFRYPVDDHLISRETSVWIPLGGVGPDNEKEPSVGVDERHSTPARFCGISLLLCRRIRWPTGVAVEGFLGRNPTMYQQQLRRFSMAWIVFSVVGCAALDGPTGPTRNVEISAADEALYWREVQRRVPAWFRNGGLEAPSLPSAEAVYSSVTFIEVPHEFLATCTFNGNNLEIRIGDDKWDSGCVPHELGHAALKLLAHPCWNNFEHPNEDPNRC